MSVAPPPLPETWPDRMRMSRPADFWRVAVTLLGFKRQRVELPADLPLTVPLPKYLLLEFHNLPNGNYSNAVTAAYAHGFEKVMMGAMREVRRAMGQAFEGRKRVVDLGCASGASTAAVAAAGVPEVIGLDASPYLLQHAQRRHPHLKFQQGLAEDTRLEAQSVDGVSACFLFHELPPKIADAALREIHRVLKPGGRLVILEPSREQLSASLTALTLRFGLRGLYFWFVAKWAHEPFVKLWHQRNVAQWLMENGFRMSEERFMFPSRLWIADRA